MLNLTAKITIGGRIFTSVASAKITTSLDDYLDTATLILPKFERGAIKEDDEVEITLGYEDVCNNYEFFGRVAEISPAPPYEIRCLDPFRDLRRTSLRRGFIRTPIVNILKEILSGTGYSLGEVSPVAGSQKINFSNIVRDSYSKPYNITKRKAIQNLATDYGFFAYFKNRRLYFLHRSSEAVLAGDAFPLFEERVNIIENSLLYHEGNTIKKVTVYSDSPGGIRLESSYIDPKIKTSTIEKKIDVSGFSNEADCFRRAKELSLQLNAPGYTGDLKTFGHPFVRAGQFCGIKMAEQKFPVIQIVRKTEVTFDQGGYRRIVTPMTTPNDVFDINKIAKQLKEFNYWGRV